MCMCFSWNSKQTSKIWLDHFDACTYKNYCLKCFPELWVLAQSTVFPLMEMVTQWYTLAQRSAPLTWTLLLKGWCTRELSTTMHTYLDFRQWYFTNTRHMKPCTTHAHFYTVRENTQCPILLYLKIGCLDFHWWHVGLLLLPILYPTINWGRGVFV